MTFNELAIQAVPYNDTLNPLLWSDNQLKTEIRYKLLLIAQHFIKFLNVQQMNLVDITISGSNASYGYSDYSDIDLHLVVKMNEELAELYTAKKNYYNFTYDIKIKGIDIELYVQDENQVHVSAGVYSILNDEWIIEPKYSAPVVSELEVKSKARNYAGQINQALKSDNLEDATKTMDDIRRLRKAGLAEKGEFSVENLAFKLLRARGKIDKLQKHIHQLESKELSFGEQSEN